VAAVPSGQEVNKWFPKPDCGKNIIIPKKKDTKSV